MNKYENPKKLFITVFSVFAIFYIILLTLFIFTSCKDNTKDTGNEVTTESQTEKNLSASDTSDNSVTLSEGDDTQTDEETDGTSDSGTTGTQATTKPPKKTNSKDDPNKKYYSYLTGLECTKTEQSKRPVSITIGNSRDAMPAVGLSRADIIYECLAEGGITRLMIVLSDYEDAPVLGSVRSSREYFIDLSRTHDTIYVHAGGNPQDYEQFEARTAINRIDGVNGPAPANVFYRDAQRRKIMSLEHTLMTSGTGLSGGIAALKYRTTLKDDFKAPFNFNTETKDIGGTNNTANYVSVPYGLNISSGNFKGEFIYNADDKLYYRKQYGTAHIDGETGEQIRFENVIVIFAEYTSFTGNEIARREGHVACNLTGDGYGFYINGGKYIIIKWKKATREGALNFFNLNGSDLYLNPGKSFICVTSKVFNKSVVINSDIKKVN